MGIQFYLDRYAYLYENIMLADSVCLAPVENDEGQLISSSTPCHSSHTFTGIGLRDIVQSMDNRRDFKNYMQNYALAAHMPKGPSREDQWAAEVANGSHFPHGIQSSPQLKMSANLQMSPALSAANQSGAPPVTFRVDLALQMERDDVEVPKIVQKCVEVIDQRGGAKALK